MIKQQKVLQNKQLLLRNIQQLAESLDECESYVNDVIAGKQAKNSQIASSINTCLSKFSGDDMAILEQIVSKNFEDAMLSHNLIKLQMAQIGLTERINNMFSQSLNQFILS